MPGNSSRRQDPFARINRWDDGYEYIQGQTPSTADTRNQPGYFSPPVMSGGREPNVSRRHRDDDDRRPRRRDPSPLSDYDAPRRRHHRDDRPPSYRSVESQSPPPRHRYHDDEPPSRRKSTRNAPQPRGYTTRSPSPPPRRSDRDDRRRHQEPRHRSPSLADRRRRRSADRHYGRDDSPPRNRGQPQAEMPGLNRSKTTTGIGLSPRWQQAAAAALQAGGIAAMTMRSEPGPWTGAKGVKVVTAALGAGAMKAKEKDGGDKRRSTGGGSGGTSRGPGGSGKGGMKTKGVEMLGTALSGFVAAQMAKKAQKGRY